MTLAGVWRAGDGSVMYVEGRDPSYTFRVALGQSVVSQGTIQPLGDGTYQGTGQGIGGPVRVKLWLAQPDVLQGRNQALIDGGYLDSVLGSFIPGLDAFQPVFTFLRQQALAAVSPLPHRPVAPVSQERSGRPLSGPPHDFNANGVCRRCGCSRSAAEGFGWGCRTTDAGSASGGKKKTQKKGGTKQPPQSPCAKPEDDPMAELQRLIGMTEVKTQVEALEAWAWRQQELKRFEMKARPPALHMCFFGGPGTGKTTVARIIGHLLRKYRLLEHGELHEVGRAELVAEFLGQTSPKTDQVIEESLGGVLFIDEAYALSEPGAGGGRDYGAEALAVLIAGMENHRDELCVIVAGYPDEMERFMDANAGLASRISHHIKFPDFTDRELREVFEAMVAGDGLQVDSDVLDAFEPYIRRAKAAAKPRQWGNARTVRNIVERGIANQSVRLRRAGGKPSRDQLLRLKPADFAFFDAPDVSTV
jgi:hypothetical protein